MTKKRKKRMKELILRDKKMHDLTTAECFELAKLYDEDTEDTYKKCRVILGISVVFSFAALIVSVLFLVLVLIEALG